MGVTGKLEIEVDIAHKGDVFHDLFGAKPHDISTITPDKVHAVDLHEGEYGKVGSIVQWDYTTPDGKKAIAKEVIEEIDEEKKIVRYRVIGGDLLKDFKSLTIAVHVVTKGDIDAVLWIMAFERFEDFGPYPTILMDLAIHVTRDIEAHHLKA